MTHDYYPRRRSAVIILAAMLVVAAVSIGIAAVTVGRGDIIAAQAAAKQRAQENIDEWYRAVARAWFAGLVDELRVAYPYDSDSMLWDRARAIVRESLGPPIIPAPPQAESE